SLPLRPRRRGERRLRPLWRARPPRVLRGPRRLLGARLSLSAGPRTRAASAAAARAARAARLLLPDAERSRSPRGARLSRSGVEPLRARGFLGDALACAARGCRGTTAYFRSAVAASAGR